MIATAALAVKATPKALYLIEEAKEEKGDELTKLEVVSVAWKPYIPAVATGASTLICIFGANILNQRNQAALASAYALLDNSYKEYKKKVVELHGEDGELQVRSEIAKDKFKEQDVQDEDDGKKLFYDDYSQRYFRATSETVLRAEYEINRMLVEDCYVSLNDLYDLLGLERVDYGEFVGWSAAQMFDMYWTAWVHFFHERIELDDGLECYILRVTDPCVDFEDY